MWPVTPDYWWNAGNVYQDDGATPSVNNGGVGDWRGLGLNADTDLVMGSDGTLKTAQVNGLPGVLGGDS